MSTVTHTLDASACATNALLVGAACPVAGTTMGSAGADICLATVACISIAVAIACSTAGQGLLCTILASTKSNSGASVTLRHAPL